MKNFLFIVLFLLAANKLMAQNPAARYEIDAKRIGVSPIDKDGLPRGREFLRLDSTYYVGWLFTGLYKNDRAVDVPGFRNALPDLLKAFTLLDKDYKGVLANMFSSIPFYVQNNSKFSDYLTLAQTLRDSYENLENPDSSMWVLDQLAKKNFRRDFLGVNQYRAWTIHRNRFFKTKDHSWLKNNVADNEALAIQYCYNALGSINRNKTANDEWFGPQQAEQSKMGVYHYLSMLHCYLKNYDSSEYYYSKLKLSGYISWNNYGGMKSEIGEFKEAEQNFAKDKYRGGGQKYLREPFYYIPTLRIYAGDPKAAIALANEAIAASNTTPGFGWYNLALARGYLYDGQLDSADLTITKATEFKEIHIGTTLTQQQYEFSGSLLRLVWYNMKIAQLKFLNKNWWYSPSLLYQISKLTLDKYMHQYLLATRLASNPERERLIYELFCAEGTTTFDEAWYLLKDFSTKYFIKKMENYALTDPRTNIKKYFDLYQAQLLYKDGDEKKSSTSYTEMLNNTVLDTATEKLFLARMYEGLANTNAYYNNNDKRDFFTNLLFENYAQLIPYSGLPTKVKLSVVGDEDAITKKVIDELKNTSIQFVDNADANTIKAIVKFTSKGLKHVAYISATSANGVTKSLANTNLFYFIKPEGAGQEIAKRIFGSSGVIELEPPAPPTKK